MNIQILPILLSPLGSMPAQPIGIPDASDILEVLVLVILNTVGVVIISGLTGMLVAKQTGNVKIIFMSIFTGICVGILIAFAWWMLIVEGEYLNNFPWSGNLYLVVVWVWPNPIGILITALAIRKIVFRLHDNRS